MDWEENKHLFGTEKYQRKIDKITFEWRWWLRVNKFKSIRFSCP
jgi:hypothetical protein